MKTKYSDWTAKEWISMWNDDKRSVLATMMGNVKSDIEAGYEPWGYSVRQSMAEIAEFTAKWERQITELARLDTDAKGRKCFEWLKESGCID